MMHTRAALFLILLAMSVAGHTPSMFLRADSQVMILEPKDCWLVSIPLHVKQLDARLCPDIHLDSHLLHSGITHLHIAKLTHMLIPLSVKHLFITHYNGELELPLTPSIYIHINSARSAITRDHYVFRFRRYEAAGRDALRYSLYTLVGEDRSITAFGETMVVTLRSPLKYAKIESMTSEISALKAEMDEILVATCSY